MTSTDSREAGAPISPGASAPAPVLVEVREPRHHCGPCRLNFSTPYLLREHIRKEHDPDGRTEH